MNGKWNIQPALMALCSHSLFFCCERKAVYKESLKTQFLRKGSLPFTFVKSLTQSPLSYSNKCMIHVCEIKLYIIWHWLMWFILMPEQHINHLFLSWLDVDSDADPLSVRCCSWPESTAASVTCLTCLCLHHIPTVKVLSGFSFPLCLILG